MYKWIWRTNVQATTKQPIYPYQDCRIHWWTPPIQWQNTIFFLFRLISCVSTKVFKIIKPKKTQKKVYKWNEINEKRRKQIFIVWWTINSWRTSTDRVKYKITGVAISLFYFKYISENLNELNVYICGSERLHIEQDI